MAKDRGQHQFNSEPKKNIQRRLAIKWHKVVKILPDKVTQFFQHTVRFFRKVWFVKLSSRKDLIYLSCYYFCFLFYQCPAQLSLFLYKFNEKKTKTKKIVQNIKYKSHEELYRENMINIQCLSALAKQHRWKIIWKFSQLPFMHIIRPE